MSGHAHREVCRDWREELAMRAIGRGGDEPGFDAHLDGCPDCRAELAELRAVADALREVDVDRLGEPELASTALRDRIMGAVGAEAARRRRSRRLLTLAAAVAVVVVATAGFLIAVTRGSEGRADAQEVALHGASGAYGEAALTSKGWGTEVTLTAEGLHEGEVYWLWLTGDDGDRIAAGTFSGTGSEIKAVLASAIELDQCRRVWITDSADAVVLDGFLEPT